METKPLHVVYWGTSNNSFCITDMELSDYFGVPCIRGKTQVTKEGHWAEGTVSHIPLSAINSVVAYQSIEAWKDSAERYQRTNQAKKRRWFGR